MFKGALIVILPFLNVLFNGIYDRGELPPDLCKNIICPLNKSGTQTSPERFRGISLIKSINKIFTGIVTTKLQKWAGENGVIDESHAGIWRGYSTTDNIFSLQALIQKY